MPLSARLTLLSFAVVSKLVVLASCWAYGFWRVLPVDCMG